MLSIISVISTGNYYREQILATTLSTNSRRLVAITLCTFLLILDHFRVRGFETPSATASFELESVGNLLLNSVSQCVAVSRIANGELPPARLELEGVLFPVELEEGSPLA